MNEIQAVKTAKIEEVKKNSKKGFTLVELVVVIAILAILAAIAIPVVASTIKSSQISSAKSNAQTVELAIKEAKAAISSGDNSVFKGASTGTIKLTDVAGDKKIESAFNAQYNIDGQLYTCAWNAADAKVYFVTSTKADNGQITLGAASGKTFQTIDGDTKTVVLKNLTSLDLTTNGEKNVATDLPNNATKAEDNKDQK